MILGKPINLPKSHFFTAGTLLQSSVLSSVTGQTVHQEPQRRGDELLNCKDSHVPEKTRVQTQPQGTCLWKPGIFWVNKLFAIVAESSGPHRNPRSHFLTDNMGRAFRRYFARRVCELRWGQGGLLLSLVLLYCDVWW